MGDWASDVSISLMSGCDDATLAVGEENRFSRVDCSFSYCSSIANGQDSSSISFNGASIVVRAAIVLFVI